MGRRAQYDAPQSDVKAAWSGASLTIEKFVVITQLLQEVDI